MWPLGRPVGSVAKAIKAKTFAAVGLASIETDGAILAKTYIAVVVAGAIEAKICVAVGVAGKYYGRCGGNRG